MAIARCVWTGTVPNTPKQVVMQDFMSAVSKAWGGTLTAVERKTWTNRALTVVWRGRFGDPYTPTGYQLFMKWNIRRKVMALSIMETAPIAQELVYIRIFGITAFVDPTSIGLQLFREGVNNIESYGVEFYKAGPYDSGGRHPIDGEWLFIARKTPPTYHVDLDVIATKWYWYRARQIAEFGDIGNWFEVQTEAI